MPAFNKALNMNINYLLSDDFSQRDDSYNTIKSLDSLVDINKLKYLTFDSQEGICEKTTTYSIEERAYVTEFMHIKRAQKFMQLFNIDTDKICIIQNNYDINSNDISAKFDIPVTLDNGKVSTHISLVYSDEIFDFERKQIKIDANEEVVILTCFDPIWCRQASSYNGLYFDIIKILKKL